MSLEACRSLTNNVKKNKGKRKELRKKKLLIWSVKVQAVNLLWTIRKLTKLTNINISNK